MGGLKFKKKKDNSWKIKPSIKKLLVFFQERVFL